MESRSSDLHVSIDVERLFASVDLAIDRYEQAWSPFVATCGQTKFAFT